MKHRQQLLELDLQEDNRTAEVLCDHWKVRKVDQCFILYYECSSENHHCWIPVCYLQKLRTSWSKRFGELAKDIFIRSVPAQSNLSAQCCEELWANLEQGLGEQLQEAECAMKLQLEAMTAQLNEDEKVANQQANHQQYFCFNPDFCLCFVGVEGGDGCSANRSHTSEGSAVQDSQGNDSQTKLYTQQVNLHSPTQILLSVETSTLQHNNDITLLCAYITHLYSVGK